MLLLLMSLSTNGRLNSVSIEKNDRDIERQLEYSSLMEQLKVETSYHFLGNIPVISPIEPSSIDRISDLYGPRQHHPILHIPTFHHGIDISANIGTDVRSTAVGVVKEVNFSKGYGTNILIKHSNNYVTRYAHLKTVRVAVGDTVKIGQIIGNVGSSGMSTGPHLHYEILRDGNTINPLSLYQMNLDTNEEKLINVYLTFLNNFESVIKFNL